MSGRARRGFTLVVVVLTIGVVTTVLLAMQTSSLRQAAAGREAVARTRAYWAARAGVESVIARLESDIVAGSSGSAHGRRDSMDREAAGSVEGASWEVTHTRGAFESARVYLGVEDPHARVNVNLMSREDLLTLPGMTEDMADAILDWIDEDDEPRPLGAEAGYYSLLPSPYEPRNGPIRSLLELELVAGVTPELVRGEGWRVSPEGIDGWSAVITAASVEARLGASGQPRLSIPGSSVEALVARVPVIDPVQAQVIIDFAARGETRMEELISTTLQQIAQQSSGLPAGMPSSTVRNLREDQLRALFDECTFEDMSGPPFPGRLNVNSAPREAFDHVTAIPPAVADAIVIGRDSSPQGFTSVLDLLQVPAVSPARLVEYSRYLTVEPGSWGVSATGRDEATGTEVRLVCVIDAVSVPVVISEVRIR